MAPTKAEITFELKVPFSANQDSVIQHSSRVSEISLSGSFRVPLVIDRSEFEIVRTSSYLTFVAGGAAWSSIEGGDTVVVASGSLGTTPLISLVGAAGGNQSSSLVYEAYGPSVQNQAENVFASAYKGSYEDDVYVVPSGASASAYSENPGGTVVFLKDYTLNIRYTLRSIGDREIPSAPFLSPMAPTIALSEEGLESAPVGSLSEVAKLAYIPPKIVMENGVLTLNFFGILQSSDDLSNWSDVETESRSSYTVDFERDPKYFRVRKFWNSAPAE